jgi:hypothetical protein
MLASLLLCSADLNDMEEPSVFSKCKNLEYLDISGTRHFMLNLLRSAEECPKLKRVFACHSKVPLPVTNKFELITELKTMDDWKCNKHLINNVDTYFHNKTILFKEAEQGSKLLVSVIL